jgi:predicted TIM-barrel fold metal-dependent hydrolase
VRYLAIDSDTHVGEPADLWTARIPGYDDVVPNVRYNEAKRRHEWWIGNKYVTLAPAGTVAGANVTPPMNPKTFEDAHPAAFQIDERIRIMDEQGIWAEVLYPNVGGFGSDHFMKIEDVGLRNECVRAYNDYLIEWIGPHTSRFAGVCMLPFWDLSETVREIERASKLGHKAILMTGKPDIWWGWPNIGAPHWNPVWEIATECGMSVSFHAGGGDPATGWQKFGYEGLPNRTRFTANSVPTFFGNAQTIVDVIFAGVLARYPNLSFVVVESGMGWISFLLECMDYQFNEHRVREASPELELLPSEYFRRQMFATFWFEEVGPSRLLEHIGADSVMFETDFPHPTSLWPPSRARAQVENALSTQPKDVREKVLWRNAARLYGLTMPTDTTLALPDAHD